MLPRRLPSSLLSMGTEADMDTTDSGLCKHEILQATCADCVAQQRYGETVYTTKAGKTFHRTPNCYGIFDGQKQASRRGDTPWQVETVTPQHAAGQMRTPCLVCYPDRKGKF
jgi:hypothetical protein